MTVLPSLKVMVPPAAAAVAPRVAGVVVDRVVDSVTELPNTADPPVTETVVRLVVAWLTVMTAAVLVLPENTLFPAPGMYLAVMLCTPAVRLASWNDVMEIGRAHV